MNSGAISLIIAQITATFSPQPPAKRALPGLTEWSVWICTAGPEARTVSGGLIYRAATQRIVPVTPSGVARVAGERERRSPVRTALLVLEGLAWAVTTAQATRSTKIADSWRALAPAAAGGLELGRNLLRRENPTWQPPANLLPPWVAVPPGGCAEHVIYARERSDEEPFSVSVAP